MRKPVAARLKWLKFAPDGSAPRPGRFVSPARFEHQRDDWRGDSWSLTIEFDSKSNPKVPQIVQVDFLANDAPINWLLKGRRFTLFDGAEAMAEGEIL
jgi:hypothetical protein